MLICNAGLTETCTVVCSTAYNDIDFGSSGSLLPSVEARLVSIEGNEITGYDQPGELLVRSPSVVLGYLNNDVANKETFVDGWMRTGDEAIIRKSPKGNEHVWVVDRIKELIKVKVGIFGRLTGWKLSADMTIGPASGTGRARSTPTYPSCCPRCGCYSCSR